MSLPIVVTAGPDPAVVDNTTALAQIVSDIPDRVRVVYPDPTDGVENPLRSVRVDMDAAAPNGAGCAIRARFVSPYDGTSRSLSTVATAVKAPDAGGASFGEPGQPFPTPRS